MTPQSILDRLHEAKSIKCAREGCKRIKLLCTYAGNTMPAEQKYAVLNQDGWSVGKNPELDRCPECAAEMARAAAQLDLPQLQKQWAEPDFIAGRNGVVVDVSQVSEFENAPAMAAEMVNAKATAADQINDLFSRVNDMSSMDWTADRNMFLGIISLMLSQAEQFIEQHFSQLAPLNQIALREAGEGMMAALARAAGLGSLLEEKDKKIAEYKESFLKSLNEIKILRRKLAKPTDAKAETEIAYYKQMASQAVKDCEELRRFMERPENTQIAALTKAYGEKNQEAADYKDKLLRALAELENVRKRAPDAPSIVMDPGGAGPLARWIDTCIEAGELEQ